MERFIVTGDGESRAVRYVVIDQATDNVVARTANRALADAVAARKNKRAKAQRDAEVAAWEAEVRANPPQRVTEF